MDLPILEYFYSLFGPTTKNYIYIYIYIYFIKKKQNRSHKDYKFISILLCVFDKIKKHEKKKKLTE